MQVVEQAAIFPGECALIPSAQGPFIDTLKVDAIGKRIYVSFEALTALLDTAGERLPRLAQLAEELERVERELARLREVEVEHERLKASVRYTLDAGRGAVQKKDGSNQLRNVPGQKTVRV